MKIYMVQADNGMNYEDRIWWNMRAFVSLEAAQKFLDNIDEEYEVAKTRDDELTNIFETRELTDNEKQEIKKIDDMWYWWRSGRSNAWIKEIEVYD